MNLSWHFTLAELTATAVRADNTPDTEVAANLEFLCMNVLEPVRAQFGAMHTTSGYRSPAVNAAIGGSKTSAHVRGLAWDGVFLRTPAVPWSVIIRWLITNPAIPVDQVIYEFGRWIHIGTTPGGRAPRRQALMIFEPGKYELFNPADKRITH